MAGFEPKSRERSAAQGLERKDAKRARHVGRLDPRARGKKKLLQKLLTTLKACDDR